MQLALTFGIANTPKWKKSSPLFIPQLGIKMIKSHSI